jgi:hypothetical protein
VTLSGSGLTQILAASTGKKITVCHISAGFASGVNFQLEYGTGASCGTGTTAVTGTGTFTTAHWSGLVVTYGVTAQSPALPWQMSPLVPILPSVLPGA